MTKLPSGNPAPARILIVDDHPNTAAMLARVLNKFDTPVEVLIACSGEEALEITGEGIIDILITDFMMPGMSGLDLVEKFKGREPAHTILITAYDTPGLELTARRLSVQDYLVKPVQPERIREIVEKALQELRPKPSRGMNLHPQQTKILIADDYPENVRLLTVRLQSEGYATIIANDGEETLAKLHTEQPELVLLDINMPKKDGFEVLAEMRADPEIAHIPVIVVTATRIGRQDVRHGLSLGADDYITKPFDWPEVVARIRAKLRVKQAEDALRQHNRELDLLPKIGYALRSDLEVIEIANLILKGAVETLHATRGELLIPNLEGTRFYQYYPSIEEGPKPDGSAKSLQKMIALIQESHQGYLIDDTQAETAAGIGEDLPFGSLVAAPLFNQEAVSGILVLYHELAQHFNQSHLVLLQAISSQASIAIENARLYQQERARTHDLVAINQLGRQINQAKSADELWERIPASLCLAFGYPAAAFWQVVDENLELVKLHGSENAPRLSLLRIAAQTSIENHQPVQISGSLDERKGTRNDAGNPPTQAALSVPIVWNDRLQAALSIHSVQPGVFHENDRVILETLAMQLAVVFERFQLLEQVNQLHIIDRP